jgi:aspartyl-tRNA(Asn)/glutamyl-tRNA(Gln) amidotransferase subunit A
MLHNFIPPYDATVTLKLKDAGTVLLGKTNLDEFAMGSSTENSNIKITKNPWDLTRVPGGSSGGSAASVMADEAFFALGSDTGGSIRQPAAFTGTVGIKPTYGHVSRYGLVAFASSLDQIGCFSKDVEDCALVLNAISGHDNRDATSANVEYPDYKKSLINDVKGFKVGVPRQFFAEGISDEVKNSVYSAIEKYKELGAQIEEFDMKMLDYALPTYYIIACSEASSNLARFDGIKYGYRSQIGSSYEEIIKNTRREGFGAEVKHRIMLGNYALSSGYYDAYYNKAVKIRGKIRAEYDEIFKTCDCILTPTAPSTAYKIGSFESDPVKMYSADICTVTVNIAGLPAISTTCGYSSNNMPIGMSIVGKSLQEATIIAVADAFEKEFTTKEAAL